MPLSLPVVIGSLGYFVDIFDLFLFGVVRVSSLTALGVPKSAHLDTGVFLLNMQMIGLLIGGLVWGVLGDKKGRRTILFGSIFLYSVANLLNSQVTSVTAYGVLRFFAGLGLAGELGAAITLVSESLSIKNRGYGTTIVASFGLLGAVAAAWVGENLSWRTAFIVGGILGLCLLILRMTLAESKMFQNAKATNVPRGDLRLLVGSKKRFLKYLQCIFAGVPIYFVVGILITFSPEFGEAAGVHGVVAGQAILYSYLGAAIGDFLSGMLSQYFKNRRRIVYISLIGSFVMLSVFLLSQNVGLTLFYLMCGLMGLMTGYWAVLITMSAEHFGTNLRATVTTSVPNFVRSAVVPLTIAFKFLKGPLGLTNSALLLGLAVTILGIVSIHFLGETFGADLDYLET